MGFFSSLKKNLTGSWADVDVRADDAERGGTLTATVTVRVRDDAIDVNKITVKLQCQEQIHIPDYRGGGTSRPAGSTGAATTRDRLDVRKTETLHTDEQTLAGAQQLSANSSHDFEATFRLPDHLPPTLEGRHAAFSWRIYASVDMKGNDPDSGWQEVTVR
ncbi:MAG: sporulation protein [Bacteroidota bacterium]